MSKMGRKTRRGYTIEERTVAFSEDRLQHEKAPAAGASKVGDKPYKSAGARNSGKISTELNCSREQASTEKSQSGCSAAKADRVSFLRARRLHNRCFCQI